MGTQIEKDFFTICRSNEWDVKEIQSEARDKQVVARRRVIAEILHAKDYSLSAIGSVLNRQPPAVINLLRKRKR